MRWYINIVYHEAQINFNTFGGIYMGFVSCGGALEIGVIRVHVHTPGEVHVPLRNLVL